MKYVIAYDIGTTGVKTCLFGIDKTITLIESAHQGYGLYLLDNGGAEQDVDEWWQAMVKTTIELFKSARSCQSISPAFPSARRCRASSWSTNKAKPYARR